MIPERVLSTILSSHAGQSIKSMVAVMERRPGFNLHLIAGAPRSDDDRGQHVALALVLADLESRPWGAHVVELDDPQVVRAVCAVGAVDVASADAIKLINLALPSLKDDVLGKRFDFSVQEEE